MITVADGALQTVRRLARTSTDMADPEGPQTFAIPGLCDFHVHVSYLPDGLASRLQSTGVTAVRDLGGRSKDVRKWGASQDVRPRVSVYGPPLDGNRPEKRIHAFGGVGISNFEQVQNHLSSHDKEQLDGIKLYYGFPRQLMPATIEAAHQRGLLVASHIGSGALEQYSLATPQQFAEAGGDTVEHIHSFTGSVLSASGQQPSPLSAGSPLSRIFEAWSRVSIKEVAVAEVAEAFAATGGRVVPTLSVLAVIAGCIAKTEQTHIWQLVDTPRDERLGYVHIGFRNMMAFVKSLHESGVPLLAGTDLAVASGLLSPTEALRVEIQLLCRSGLSAVEALLTASQSAFLCQDSSSPHHGFHAGIPADIVCFNASRPEDILNHWDITGVMIRGETISGSLPMFRSREQISSAQVVEKNGES